MILKRGVTWPNADNLNNVACFIISDSEDRQAHDPKKRRNMAQCRQLE